MQRSRELHSAWPEWERSGSCDMELSGTESGWQPSIPATYRSGFSGPRRALKEDTQPPCWTTTAENSFRSQGFGPLEQGLTELLGSISATRVRDHDRWRPPGRATLMPPGSQGKTNHPARNSEANCERSGGPEYLGGRGPYGQGLAPLVGEPEE